MIRTLDEVQRDISELYSQFPQVVTSQNLIRRLVTAPLRAAEPGIVLMLGESGVGKTTMLLRTTAEFPRIKHDEFTEIPLLYVRVPSKCTYGSLTMAVLRALATPLISSGSDQDRLEQVKTLMSNCRVRGLILDDANQMVDRGRTKSHYLLGDWVREVSDVTRAHVLLSGVRRLWSMVETNEQLRSRVSHQISLEPFEATAESENSILLPLQAFDKCLVGMLHVSLISDKARERFAFATGGRLRPLRNILLNAVEIAFEAPKVAIDFPVLERAFSRAMFQGAPAERNPFSIKFNGRPLTGRGEPFDPRSGALND